MNIFYTLKYTGHQKRNSRMKRRAKDVDENLCITDQQELQPIISNYSHSASERQALLLVP